MRSVVRLKDLDYLIYFNTVIGTEPKRTGSGTETFKILRPSTGTETFILIIKVPELNRNF